MPRLPEHLRLRFPDPAGEADFRERFVTRELSPVTLKGVGEIRTYLLEAAR